MTKKAKSRLTKAASRSGLVAGDILLTIDEYILAGVDDLTAF